jgi:hypothetical protein
MTPVSFNTRAIAKNVYAFGLAEAKRPERPRQAPGHGIAMFADGAVAPVGTYNFS